MALAATFIEIPEHCSTVTSADMRNIDSSISSCTEYQFIVDTEQQSAKEAQ